MNWAAWAQVEKKRNLRDKRVQAIRCASCHRLRPYPDRHRITCACGAMDFTSTYPHPDEHPIAMRLYAKELEEAGVFTKIVREIIDDWRSEHGAPDDKPERRRLILA